MGLTGGIGAGKSEALRALRRLGAATLSSDAVVHELLESDEVRDRLVERLGSDVAPGGAVDRQKVAEAVFARPEQRGWLEGELWPRVARRIAAWREEAAAGRPPAVVVEVPLLFEAGMEAAFDRTVAVVAPEELRARRASERGHAGLEDRSSRQLPQSEKAERADYVVHNEGDIGELEQKLSRLLETLAEVDTQ